MMENQLITPNGNAPYLVYYEEVLIDKTCANSPQEAIGFVCRRHPNFDNPEAKERLCAVLLTDELNQKEQKKLKRLGKLKYLVFVNGKPKKITEAVSSAKAVDNFCHHYPDVNREHVTAEILTAKLYKNHKRALKRAGEQDLKVKAKWQPLLYGKPFGKYPTEAKTQKRAGCNRWYTKMKSKEHPTSDKTKGVYHEGVSARLLFGQPAKNRKADNRKASHAAQLSLPTLERHHKE